MRVVVTDRRFPDRDPYGDLVEAAGGELEYGDCGTEADAVELCRDADIVIAGFAPVTERVLDAAGAPRLVLRHATGYDNVDLRAATARGIPVSNVPGYAPRDVASHAFALLLAAAHDVVRHDAAVRAGPGWGERATLRPIHGGTLGVVGLGRIGREIVPMARGLHMDVIAHDPHLDDDVFDRLDVPSVTLDALLERADAVTIHAPLTQHTHHLIDADALSRLDPAAVLVNAARGPIVDEDALLSALDAGGLRAAGLDVFEDEPPTGSPLLDHDRVVVSPHRAGHTEAAAERVIEIARAELARALDGEPLRNVVNPSVHQYRGW